jgi:hypothetical protein
MYKPVFNFTNMATLQYVECILGKCNLESARRQDSPLLDGCLRAG